MLYPYPEGIPSSQEVEDYQNDFEWIIGTDWRARANERFWQYHQDPSDQARYFALSSVALALTKEEVLRQISELDVLYEQPSVPHPQED